ncbi:leucine-rich repeat domain-containing protein [Abyssalbus ytuae]|uniref:Protein phosphatase 1 regulatory subunit 42 n=1 Tax=Abyssalbus ytuae TaxID=2926907 RepID=A0A9E6ZLW2_9FLAO|nr:protein phosphatase 1 regulatory subunit 42 [Abyssalbus ytuae]UOB17044.1 protein phosphatase 1 regulatory subunit 42 [Abyssalbus ytuae]
MRIIFCTTFLLLLNVSCLKNKIQKDTNNTLLISMNYPEENNSVDNQDHIKEQVNTLIAIYKNNPQNNLKWDIKNKNINTWNGVVTDDNGNITELYLYNKELTVIPKEIKNLKNLKILFLYNNKLKEIPLEIEHLINLTELSLYNNQLTSIPPQIGKLTNLKRLYLDNNKLTSVPEEIGNLKNLNDLNLRKNDISHLPEKIKNLPLLTELSF